MRSALLFYRNGGFELWDWQFLRNPDRLTRPCTDCRLATSSRSSLSEVEAVAVAQKAEMLGMEGYYQSLEAVAVEVDMVAVVVEAKMEEVVLGET